MVYKNKEKRRAYQRAYYQHKIKPKRNKQQWNISKQAWVKCPYCNHNSRFQNLNPHEPEVFAMLYGGRGKLRKFSEEDFKNDAPHIWEGVKKAYLEDLKLMSARFLYCYCSKEELLELMNDMGVKLSIAIESDLVGFSVPSTHAVNMVASIQTNGISARTRWE